MSDYPVYPGTPRKIDLPIVDGALRLPPSFGDQFIVTNDGTASLKVLDWRGRLLSTLVPGDEGSFYQYEEALPPGCP